MSALITEDSQFCQDALVGRRPWHPSVRRSHATRWPPARRAARRAQLITIGRAVFAEGGYEATSVEEIAAWGKVSKPILYEHFGGKEGL
jgi:hypothetical protein